MTVALTPAKKLKILPIFVELLATEQAPKKQVAQLLRTFSSGFIELLYGKLYYRSQE